MPLISFSGLASGIDANALIDATKKAREQAYQPTKDQITKLTDTNTALDEFRTRLQTLSSSVQQMRAINGGAVAKTATSTDETVATATASNAATNTTFTLTVNQIARPAVRTYSDTFTAGTDLVASSLGAGTDTISVVVGTGSSPNGETINLSVTGTTTIESLVNNFNAASTSAVATLVNTAASGATPSYQLMISAIYEGTQKGSLSITVGAGVQAGPPGTRFQSATSVSALDAQFTISGIGSTITRSSNTISDVIPGVTIQLVKSSGTSTPTITVKDDIATTTNTVQDFVDAYNEMILYLRENNLIVRDGDSEDALNVFGPLSSSRVDENAVANIRSGLTSANAESGRTVRVSGDLGLQTQRDGTIKLVTADLAKAISEEPASVRNILQDFGEAVGKVDGTIALYTRLNGHIDNAVNNNKSLITILNDRIARADRSIAREEEMLRLRFSRLESLVSGLQSKQAQLTSALAGL